MAGVEFIVGKDVVVPWLQGASPSTGGVLSPCSYRFDAAIIGTLMINAGVSSRGRSIANGLYALVVPLGAVAFLASLRVFGGHQETIIGVAMALAAGAFLCIAAADLLPEVQFHSHDRVMLTMSLALGLAIAWGITVMERSSHAHTHAHVHATESHGGR